MTTEVMTPATIKAEMEEFILGLGYVCPAEYSPGLTNPATFHRESEPQYITYHLFALEKSRKDISVLIITNSFNDVVNINFRTGKKDSVLSRYFEVNSVHDREYAKEFIQSHSA